MDQKDPFDSFGLDFSALNNYVRTGKGQQSNYYVDAVDLLSAGSQLGLQIPDASIRAPSVPQQGRLRFLAGCPSPEQIDRLTKEHKISPEFWRRHLGPILIETNPTFEDLKLPSADCGIFQLRFWTIGSRPINIIREQESIFFFW
jgi:hypothetical protein